MLFSIFTQSRNCQIEPSGFVVGAELLRVEMKSKCINGNPHYWIVWLEKGVEYQACKYCKAFKARPLEHYKPTYGDSRRIGISHFEEVKGG